MIRRLLATGALLALTIGAAAQDATLPPLRTIETPFHGPLFSLSPDGTLLAVHENEVVIDNDVPEPSNLPILLIDVETGSEVGRLEGVQRDIARRTAFSPDGTQLASYHINGELIIWDIGTQEALHAYDWLPFGGGMIDYMPDGESLVIVTQSGVMAQHVLFDLATGSITDILAVRPTTFAEVRDVSGNIAAMGLYSVAAQAVGPNGEIYGANGNGDVYRWDTETRLRELIYPTSNERPLMYPVRELQVLDNGSLAFLDTGRGEIVVYGPDGIRSQYPLNGQIFALSGDGIAVSADAREDALFWIDLNAAGQEPQRIDIVPEGDNADEPPTYSAAMGLAFTNEGDLIVSGFYSSIGESEIYILELP